MGWLFGWLLFGTLAANQIAGLPSTGDRQGPILLVILCTLLAIASLLALTVSAARHGRRTELTFLSVISLGGLAVVLWVMRHGRDDAQWLAMLVAAEAFFFSSFCTALVGMVFSWRVRRRRKKLRRELQSRADHRARLDRMGMPINPIFKAMGLHPEEDPWPEKRGSDER
jgi:hypothetical protein